MKNLTGIILALLFVISLMAYGCTASGSVGTNNQTAPKTTASAR